MSSTMIDWGATPDISPDTDTDALEPSETIRVNTASRAVLLDRVRDCLQAGRGFTLATLNLDHIVKMGRSKVFRLAYARQTFVVADGNPIVWLSRLAGRRIELVPGSELITPLTALAAELDKPVALLGATEETLNIAAIKLEQAHPGVRIVARIAPPFGFDPEGVSAQDCLGMLSDSGARLCFLALGAPKQEVFAAFAAPHLPDCGFVSIGAGLDFIAGSQTRAPWIIRKLTLEWVWRMLSNPRRLVLRYAACIAILPGQAVQAIRARRAGHR